MGCCEPAHGRVDARGSLIGSLLIDIGGQTTDIAVYFDGSIHYPRRNVPSEPIPSRAIWATGCARHLSRRS